MNPFPRIVSLLLAGMMTALALGGQVRLAGHYDDQARELAASRAQPTVARTTPAATRRG